MRRALSMVEVLVTVVVMGSGIAVAASAVGTSIKAEKYSADLTRAANHADLILARLESGDLPLEDSSGDFEDDGHPEVAWQVELDTTETENMGLAIITILWTTDGVERELVLERWVFIDPLDQTR